MNCTVRASARSWWVPLLHPCAELGIPPSPLSPLTLLNAFVTRQLRRWLSLALELPVEGASIFRKYVGRREGYGATVPSSGLNIDPSHTNLVNGGSSSSSSSSSSSNRSDSNCRPSTDIPVLCPTNPQASQLLSYNEACGLRMAVKYTFHRTSWCRLMYKALPASGR